MFRLVYNRVQKIVKRYYRKQLIHVAKKISIQDAKRHVYLTGKTGCWKSSLLEQRIYYLRYKTRKENDVSIIYLDPHGDTSEKVKKFDLVNKYADRLVYIDPFLKQGYTPCLNPLELNDKKPESVELYTQQLVRVFEEMIPDAKLSNYMKAVLIPCISTMLFQGNCDLSHLQQFMSKDTCSKRIEIGKKSIFESHRRFFDQEFHNRIFNATKWSIYTKIQSLLNSSVFSNMVSWTSTVHLDRYVRKGKIVLFNLSKGRMGEEVSETLGRLIIAQVKRIALSRANLPPHLRKPIFLIIDEAESFIKWDSLNVILKETRKYGLHLVLCTQNLISGRNRSDLKRNVLSNTNIKIIGSNSIGNLKPLSTETDITLAHLLNLKSFEFYLKSGDSEAFKIRTKDVLGSRSPLLLNRWSVRYLNHNLATESEHYKEVVPNHPQIEDRIDDLPEDLHEAIWKKESPSPKFAV